MDAGNSAQQGGRPAGNHDFSREEAMRRSLIERGRLFFPLVTKPCSISFASTVQDIEVTIEQVEKGLSQTPR